eukprot:scaffold113035_cov35-Tisochrysis_lutea.AAC.6
MAMTWQTIALRGILRANCKTKAPPEDTPRAASGKWLSRCTCLNAARTLTTEPASDSKFQQRYNPRSAADRAIAPQSCVRMAFVTLTSSGRPMHFAQLVLYGQKSNALC